jgi:hypothetical protein
MYEVTNRTWDEFKYEILGDTPVQYWVKSTYGKTKPRLDRYKVVETLIDDDIHFEVMFEDGTKSSYMLVSYRESEYAKSNGRTLEIKLQDPKVGCNCLEGNKVYLSGKAIFTCYSCGGQYEV